MKKITRERKRINSVYPTLSQCANHLLEYAATHKTGKYYDYMASIVFSAFTMEAFINYLGSTFFSDWNKIERKLSRTKHREKIYKYLSINSDKTKRPYSTIDEIFLFRDSLAHAKKIDLCDTPSSPINDLRADWEKYCTKQNAEKAKKDVLAVIKELFKKSGLQGSYLSPNGDIEESTITIRNI